MSELDNYTLGTRPVASSNTGLCIFRSDTKAIEVSDGTNWLAYIFDKATGWTGSSEYSVLYDGIDSYTDFGQVSMFNEASDITLSFWANTTTTSQFPSVGIWTSPSQQFGFVGDTYNLVIVRGPGGTSGNVLTYTHPGTGWHHYFLVYGSSRGDLYIDGNTTPVSSDASLPASLDSSGHSNFRAGGYGNNPTYVDGKIDGIALWDSALTTNNLTTIYNNGTPGDLSSLNPTHWWTMGDNENRNNSTVFDLGSTVNNGTNLNDADFSNDAP